jgi:hypothetical protein
VRLSVLTAEGVFLVDLEDGSVLGPAADAEFDPAPEPVVPPSLPRLLAASAAGSTVVALVDAKPPLLVSHDAGRTWKDAGRGLPAGRAIAVSAENPDDIVFAARNRLYVSGDGGRFWRSLEVELPDIQAASWAD